MSTLRPNTTVLRPDFARHRVERNVHWAQESLMALPPEEWGKRAEKDVLRNIPNHTAPSVENQSTQVKAAAQKPRPEWQQHSEQSQGHVVDIVEAPKLQPNTPQPRPTGPVFENEMQKQARLQKGAQLKIAQEMQPQQQLVQGLNPYANMQTKRPQSVFDLLTALTVGYDRAMLPKLNPGQGYAPQLQPRPSLSPQPRPGGTRRPQPERNKQPRKANQLTLEKPAPRPVLAQTLKRANVHVPSVAASPHLGAPQFSPTPLSTRPIQ